MAGRTTIVISHNLVTVRDADRIAVLESAASPRWARTRS
jgi:ABC-type multidrug transport system fused ATPase/permease subunit